MKVRFFGFVAAILLAQSLMLSCTKSPTAESLKPATTIMDTNGPLAEKEIYDLQVLEMPKTVAALCRFKKFCQINDGELLMVFERCLNEKFSCEPSSECKTVRFELKDPARYLDGWGTAVHIVNSSSTPQIVSFGADKKVGGLGLDSDIVRKIDCSN